MLVITDGYPRSSRVRFFAKPTRFSSTNDSGEQTGESLKSGRVSLWQTQEDETRDVARALEALEDPSRTVLGIGIGVDAPVDEFFEHAHAYADHEAFAEGFPALLESALSELFL
ncbi:MAG TPA: hypothetical protein QGF58_09785 [Myxococcota bacterium]|nr:hypothetical protein [Myxococcota bacterium]